MKIIQKILKFLKKKESSKILKEKILVEGNDEIGEEYWLELFGKIYEILKDSQKGKELIFSQIKNYLSEKVEDLLLTMSYYVSFNFILKKVSKELEFSLLKNFLNKNIYTKSHLSYLYKSYINLISYKINKDIKILEINGQKGKNVNLIIKDEEQLNSEKINLIINKDHEYNYSRTNTYHNIELENKLQKNKYEPKKFKKCSLCLKILDLRNENLNEDNTDIIIFKCNHIFHMKCLSQENSNSIKKLGINSENFCPKCVNVDDELFTFVSNKKESIDNQNDNIEQLNINNKEDNEINITTIEKRKKKIEEKMKKKNFKKLTLLDNDYFEQINILENTLNGD